MQSFDKQLFTSFVFPLKGSARAMMLETVRSWISFFILEATSIIDFATKEI